jgi:hypothetical protein
MLHPHCGHALCLWCPWWVTKWWQKRELRKTILHHDAYSIIRHWCCASCKFTFVQHTHQKWSFIFVYWYMKQCLLVRCVRCGLLQTSLSSSDLFGPCLQIGSKSYLRVCYDLQDSTKNGVVSKSWLSALLLLCSYCLFLRLSLYALTNYFSLILISFNEKLQIRWSK